MLKLRTTPPSPFLKVSLGLGLAMIAFALWGLLESSRRWPPKEGDLAAVAMISFWGIVIAEVSRRSIAHGTSYLRIDRGTLTVIDNRLERESIRLVDVGELTVVDHTLRAAGLPNRVLFSSHLLLDVQQRRIQLERIIGEAQIRELLTLDAPADGAFRDDPTLAFRARQLIPNPVRLREVLDAIGDDAAVLRRAIDTSTDRDQSV